MFRRLVVRMNLLECGANDDNDYGSVRTLP